jgi:hypothetical protein
MMTKTIKCLFGLREWEDTGKQQVVPGVVSGQQHSMFYHIFKCKMCGKESWG